jgi:hypothetical protein
MSLCTVPNHRQLWSYEKNRTRTNILLIKESYFKKYLVQTNFSSRAEVHPKFSDQLIEGFCYAVYNSPKFNGFNNCTLWSIIVVITLGKCAHRTPSGVWDRHTCIGLIKSKHFVWKHHFYSWTQKRWTCVSWIPCCRIDWGSIRGWNFFLSKWVMLGIKMSVFLRRFQKYKLA